jgi:hypothetical protein
MESEDDVVAAKWGRITLAGWNNHPYLARAWAKRDSDLRVEAPGQAKKRAVIGALDFAAHKLTVSTSATKRSSDFIGREWRRIGRVADFQLNGVIADLAAPQLAVTGEFRGGDVDGTVSLEAARSNGAEVVIRRLQVKPQTARSVVISISISAAASSGAIWVPSCPICRAGRGSPASRWPAV